MKAIFTLLITLLTLASFSQGVVQNIVRDPNQAFNIGLPDGTIIKRTTFNEEGFTTLPVNNCTATLKTKQGKVYNHVNGRIDLLTNRYIFRLNDQELMF